MAYTKTNWLDHVVDGGGQVIQQGTPLSAANLNRMEQGIADAHAQFEDSARQTVTLRHGMNVIQADQASPLNATVYGRTLVNLLGRDGGCESMGPFLYSGMAPSVSTIQKKSGLSSIKFEANGGSSYAFKDYSYPLDTSKQYVLAGWIYIESISSASVVLSIRDIGTTNARYTVPTSLTTIGSWQFVVVRIPTANALVGNGFRLLFGLTGTSTAVAYFDDIRLYEVSAADYSAIGTTYIGEQIDAFIPYVDGVQHLQGPVIRKVGKNMLPPFTEWTLVDPSRTIVMEPYKLELQGTASATQTIDVFIDVLSNTIYSIAVTTNGTGGLIVRKSDGSVTFLNKSGNSTLSGTFMTDATTTRIYVRLYNNAGAGTYIFSDPMLVIGEVSALPNSFEPRNDDYMYIPTKLTSSIDGSVRDSMDTRTGLVTRRWRGDVVLDGSLSWVSVTSFAGFKRLALPSYPSGTLAFAPNGYVIKHTGHPLQRFNSGWNSADLWLQNGADFNVTVGVSDSGWGDDFTPSNAEVKAYFYGWKMNNGTFGQLYNGSGTKTWVPWNSTDNTGAVTTVPTMPSIAITSGAYDYYRLSYQLAATVTEAVKGFEGAIGLHDGGNAVELLEGVIVRERVQPALVSGEYQINTRPENKIANKVDVILNVYKGRTEDRLWRTKTRSSSDTAISIYGNQYAGIATDNFDPTADYFVTYIALDRHKMTTNAVEATAS